jgi:hypothetical protein
MVHIAYVENLVFYGLLGLMALFFLPGNRSLRWLGLVIYGLHLGLGHYYLDDVFAAWAYYLWTFLPLGIVFFGWWLEQSKRPKLELATS